MTFPRETTLELLTSTAEFARAEDALSGLIARGLPPAIASDVRLVLEEAFTNIVKYAHADRGSHHRVRIHLAWFPDRLEIEIVDDGHAFDPLAHAADELDKPFRERADGRMGLALIRGLMDWCHYRREHGHNRLRLRKHIPAAM